jgi:hypothetical protein
MNTITESDNRELLRRLLRTTPESLLEALSTRQHLRPHEPLGEAVLETTRVLGVCPVAVEQALRWLGFDPSLRAGRVRRTEMTQLASAIHRFWRQNASQKGATTSPP